MVAGIACVAIMVCGEGGANTCKEVLDFKRQKCIKMEIVFV